jgi:hypothetical protein
MQFTWLINGCGAGWARYCVNLLPRNFSDFHCPNHGTFRTILLLNIAHRTWQDGKELLYVT